MDCKTCGCKIKEYDGVLWHISPLSTGHIKMKYGYYGCRNPEPNFRTFKEKKILKTAGNLRKRRWHDFEYFRKQKREGQKVFSEK